MEGGGSVKVKVKQLLSRYDDDKSGELEMDEFRLCLEGFLHGISDAEIEALASKFDADGSGAVSVAEFTDALMALAKHHEENGGKPSGPMVYNGVVKQKGRRPLTDEERAELAEAKGVWQVSAREEAVAQFFHSLRARSVFRELTPPPPPDPTSLPDPRSVAGARRWRRSPKPRTSSRAAPRKRPC